MSLKLGEYDAVRPCEQVLFTCTGFARPSLNIAQPPLHPSILFVASCVEQSARAVSTHRSRTSTHTSLRNTLACALHGRRLSGARVAAGATRVQLDTRIGESASEGACLIATRADTESPLPAPTPSCCCAAQFELFSRSCLRDSRSCLPAPCQ
eukprot:1040381-Pleurochrysis_carterae.AAC.1